MAKCATCGENNPENIAFCAKCGSPLAENKMANDLALENAQKEFDKDAKISINREKITYVCELCGAINRIDNPACTKCGKPRPRGEFVSALKRIKDGSILAEQEAIAKAQKDAELQAIADAEAAQKAETVEAAAVIEQAEAQAPLAEEKPQLSLFRYEPNPTTQTQAIHQPFVIVPYVDSQQQLWQYQPKQVYKFEPFSVAEKDARAQKQAEITNGAEPTAEELIRLRSAKQQEIKDIDNNLNAMASKQEKVIVYSKKTKSVRTSAIFAFIFAVALLVATLALPVINSLSAYKGFEVFKSFGNCIAGSFQADLGFSTTAMAYAGWTSWIVPIVYAVISIFAIVIIIHSVSKLATGRARVKGYVLPIISLVLSIAAAVAVMYQTNSFKDVLEGIKNIGYGLYVAIGASLILMVVGFCSPKNTKNNGSKAAKASKKRNRG